MYDLYHLFFVTVHMSLNVHAKIQSTETKKEQNQDMKKSIISTLIDFRSRIIDTRFLH